MPRFRSRPPSCVIGGGIAGVATALELAERGIDVVLLEKGEIAAEQSSRNWGWCRQMAATRARFRSSRCRFRCGTG